MNVLNRLRNRPDPEGHDAVGPADAGPADEHQPPLARYDKLGAKQVVAQLNQLSQVELADFEAHERSHGDRPEVLAKLRWLRGSEPLPGYDALDSNQIFQALAGADAGTVKAVREYEHKFQQRRDVIDEVARVLPTSALSAREENARDEKAERVSASTRPAQNGQGLNGARPEA